MPWIKMHIREGEGIKWVLPKKNFKDFLAIYVCRKLFFKIKKEKTLKLATCESTGMPVRIVTKSPVTAGSGGEPSNSQESSMGGKWREWHERPQESQVALTPSSWTLGWLLFFLTFSAGTDMVTCLHALPWCLSRGQGSGYQLWVCWELNGQLDWRADFTFVGLKVRVERLT